MNIPKGDYGYNLTFIVQELPGVPYPLVGYMVKLKVWVAGAPGTLLTNGDCLITSPTEGICTYLVKNTDFTAVGIYQAELELSKAGAVESTQSFTIRVIESG